jgi:hypothetical protein
MPLLERGYGRINFDLNNWSIISMKNIKPIVMALAIVSLASCSVTPNLETGCWRLGVEEINNTGPMSSTKPEDVPVVYMGLDALADACGTHRKGWTTRACYKPIENTIFMWTGSGKFELEHERCHIRFGRKHNACNGTYGNAGTVHAPCEW